MTTTRTTVDSDRPLRGGRLTAEQFKALTGRELRQPANDNKEAESDVA